MRGARAPSSGDCLMADEPKRLRDYGLQSERLLWPTKGPSKFEEDLGVAAHGSCPHHTISRVLQLSGATGALQRSIQLNTALPGVNQPTCIGGDVWGTPTIDPATGIMYIATGDADPSCGDEAWASAIIARPIGIPILAPLERAATMATPGPEISGLTA